MDKTDAMKAMKAARAAEWARANRETSPTPRPARLVAVPEPAAVREPAAVPAPALASESADTVPCGHRAISGKSCIRDKGHAEQDHRYAKATARA